MNLAIFFTGTLMTSIAALVMLFSIKRFEMKTGRVFLGSLRPRIGGFFHTLLLVVERALPRLTVFLVRRSVVRSRASVQKTLARSLVKLERSLEGALHMLRHTTAPIHPRTREVSVFLREVAEHKKQLLTSLPAQTGSRAAHSTGE